MDIRRLQRRFIMSFDNYEQASLLYWKMAKESNFIDDSALLEQLWKCMGTTKRYVCLSCPESMHLELTAMAISFFHEGCDMSDIFDSLHIAESPSYTIHLNRHYVFSLDMIGGLDCSSKVQTWLGRIEMSLFDDLCEAFPKIKLDINKPITVNLRRVTELTGKRFIFMLNNWDRVFQMPFMESTESQNEYLNFLEVFFYNQSFCELALLIGNKPITDFANTTSMFTNLKWPDC